MRAAVLAIVTVFTCVAASAQYSVVSEAEYNTACGKAVPVPIRARAERYRMILETKSTMKGRPSTDYASRTVTNYQDRTKWHTVRENTFGETKKLSEEISVDGKAYVREGTGEWVEKTPRTVDRSGDPAETQTRYVKIEYRLLADEMFKGEMAKVCEKYELIAVKNSGSETEAEREITMRYWMTDEGMLKSENSYRSISANRTTTSWIKNEWEIDPTITVAIPAKFAQQK